MMRSRAILLFAGVSLGLLGLLAADRYVHRPRIIAAPPYADSLAGVVARLIGTDSAQIAKVKWQESPERWLGLNWIATDPYRYRDSLLTGNAPAVGQADLKAFTITFAKGQVTPAITKHELTHLFLHDAGHPPAIFAKVESYTGR